MDVIEIANRLSLCRKIIAAAQGSMRGYLKYLSIWVLLVMMVVRRRQI